MSTLKDYENLIRHLDNIEGMTENDYRILTDVLKSSKENNLLTKIMFSTMAIFAIGALIAVFL